MRALILVALLAFLLGALGASGVHASSSLWRSVDVEQCIRLQTTDSPSVVKNKLAVHYQAFMNAVSAEYPGAQFGPREAGRALEVRIGMDC